MLIQLLKPSSIAVIQTPLSQAAANQLKIGIEIILQSTIILGVIVVIESCAIGLEHLEVIILQRCGYIGNKGSLQLLLRSNELTQGDTVLLDEGETCVESFKGGWLDRGFVGGLGQGGSVL